MACVDGRRLAALIAIESRCAVHVATVGEIPHAEDVETRNRGGCIDRQRVSWCRTRRATRARRAGGGDGQRREDEEEGEEEREAC